MTIAPLVRDAETAEFLDGTARGEFLLRRCPEGHWSEPSAYSCTTCLTPELSWSAAAGEATLVSWVVPHVADGPGAPLVIGALEEGPWWWSCLVGDVDPATLAVGLPLVVAFERASEEHEMVPVFRLAAGQ
ncbi:MAG: Zn-ribbon domain-containing OB-fold protein [Mycobacteriales bacterium]